MRRLSWLVLLLGLWTGPSSSEGPASSFFNPFSQDERGRRYESYRLPAEGLVMVQSGDKVYFVSDNGRFLIRGQVYDTWNGTFLTTVEEARRVGDRIVLSRLPIDIDKDLKPFYLGEGKKEAVVFIDPHCPYCHKLLKKMEELKDWRFKLILIPALGDRSAQTIRLLRCGTPDENRNREVVARLLKADYQNLKDERCDLAPFLKSVVLAKILGIAGVPFLIHPDGRVMRGYVEDFKSWMEDRNAR